MKIKVSISREYDTTGDDHDYLFEGMTSDECIKEALRLFGDDLDFMNSSDATVEVSQ